MSDFENDPMQYRMRDLGIVHLVGDLTDPKSVSWVEFPAVQLADHSDGLEAAAPVLTQDLVDAGVTFELPEYYDYKRICVWAEVNVAGPQVSDIRPDKFVATTVMSAEMYKETERAWNGEI
jgi:hypothetical protein